jgi:thiamine monophosphate kinase
VIEIMKPANLKLYAGLCGRVLARAHARSGDSAILTGYLGRSTLFEDAVAEFSVAYAKQNERDHAALLAAIRAGRIDAATVE